MSSTLARAALMAMVSAAGLAACGGNSDASIGGSLSGLAGGGSVTLQNNGGDNLTLGGNGGFAFSQKVSAKDDYNVAVLNQPATQTCTVSAGSGTVDSAGDDVTNVAVSCVSRTTLLGGTVSGLVAGTAVTLSNGTVLLPLAANGAFTFPGLLTLGATYIVTVQTQPSGATCVVANGTGTVTADVAVAVTVTCS